MSKETVENISASDGLCEVAREELACKVKGMTLAEQQCTARNLKDAVLLDEVARRFYELKEQVEEINFVLRKRK